MSEYNCGLICIVSETNGGKDSVAKYLKNIFGLDIVCSYATRPIRTNEVEGEEHFFITDERMQELLKLDDVFAYTKIEAKDSKAKGYEYCTLNSQIADSSVYIIDPNGIDYLNNVRPDVNKTVIYIYASEDTRRERAEKRGDNMSAFEDRVDNEREQFDNFRNNKQYDYFVSNDKDGEFEEVCNQIVTILGLNK